MRMRRSDDSDSSLSDEELSESADLSDEQTDEKPDKSQLVPVGHFWRSNNFCGRGCFQDNCGRYVVTKS